MSLIHIKNVISSFKKQSDLPEKTPLSLFVANVNEVESMFELASALDIKTSNGDTLSITFDTNPRAKKYQRTRGCLTLFIDLHTEKVFYDGEEIKSEPPRPSTSDLRDAKAIHNIAVAVYQYTPGRHKYDPIHRGQIGQPIEGGMRNPSAVYLQVASPTL